MLDAFFQTIAPLLTGQAALSETVTLLYGPEAATRHARDAERLAIYQRFCRIHRFEALEFVYSHCRKAVLAGAGAGPWDDLVEDYFRAHPMLSFELNENGIHLPAFLGDYGGRAALPPFVPELADFEWWEWQTQIAPDDAADRAPESGPLRLGSTVELRRYGADFVSWIDDTEDDARAAAPEQGDTLVLFWRDRELRSRRDRASAMELLVLRTVYEGRTIEQLISQGSGLSQGALEETIADLRQAGILLGQP